PAELGRPLRPRMAELDRHLGVGLGMDEVDKPLPCAFVRIGVEAGASGGNAPFRRDASHLGEDETGAALGTLGICTKCQSFGVPSAALYCAIGETQTRLASSRPRTRSGTNIGGRAALGLAPV